MVQTVDARVCQVELKYDLEMEDSIPRAGRAGKVGGPGPGGLGGPAGGPGGGAGGQAGN